MKAEQTLSLEQYLSSTQNKIKIKTVGKTHFYHFCNSIANDCRLIKHFDMIKQRRLMSTVILWGKVHS